jgi:hypothetical protein
LKNETQNSNPSIKNNEFYEPKGLDVSEGENRGYSEAITLLAAMRLTS